MSFTIEAVIPQGLADSAYNIVAVESEVIGNDDCPRERDYAVKQVAGIIQELLESNALGNSNDHAFSVQVTGHINPDNQPREGISNDFVSIGIYQLKSE